MTTTLNPLKAVDVTLIPGCNPGPYTGPTGNNTYLIRGSEPALIDAATGAAGHLDALAQALAGAPLCRVVVTHGHGDHASGSEAIAKRWPDAVFLKMPWPERDERHRVDWRPLAPDERVPAGDGDLRVVHTPGHAPDHVCLMDESTGTLFSGDMVIQGRSVVVPSHGGVLTRYLESLARIRRLAPARTLPAHGPEIGDLDALVGAYLQHRQRREAQIMAALGSAPHTRDALVASIYPELSDALQFPAGESVLAHLRKLRDQGDVTEQGGEWRCTSTERSPVPPRDLNGR